ncbi:imidazole glycerol phosphate synthase subunit HisH [Litorivivens sp.]|uniref:imidazole glycerol phosphate synthase subunit HisH n=1 Tax=Litorivivens sp. TaxID=2020868 RepID=UPI0035682ADA
MSTPSVAVIDYGMGNLHSVASALAKVGGDVEARVTNERSQIISADRVIFPGVGAIRDCMGEIRRLKLDDVVNHCIDAGKPVLAVCVGMQALMTRSEENGGVDCFDTIAGQVRYFGKNHVDADGNKLKVPHMGWNNVFQKKAHPLWQGIADGSRFYFVHSYFVQVEDESLVAGVSEYGRQFHSVLARDNVFAAQFHPEKSGEAGLQLLKNFLAWDGKP